MNREFWEQFAQADPLWVILSDPSKRGRRWELGPFLETGRREISLVLYQPAELDRPPAKRAALDFGCGVGRLTQALAEHFDSATGVVVSETMLTLARRLNRHGDRVTYLHHHAATCVDCLPRVSISCTRLLSCSTLLPMIRRRTSGSSFAS